MKPRAGNVPVKRSQRYLRRVPGTALLLHTLLSILLQLSWYLFPDEWGWFAKNNLTGYILSIVLMQGLCVLLPAFLTIWLYRLPAGLVAGYGSGTRARAGTMILAFTLGIPAAVMLLSFNNSLVFLLARTGLTLPLPILPSFYIAPDFHTRLLLSLTIGFLPAVTEEILFRGVLQSSMVAIGRPGMAIGLTAMSFSLFHADPLFLVAPLGAAIMLGYLRLKTESLLPCIATHFSMNLTLLWIQPLMPRLSGISFSRIAPSETFLYASLVAFTLSAAVAVPLTLLLGGDHRDGSDQERPRTLTIFPVDWRYWLATLVLVVTIIVIFLASTEI